MKPRSVYDKTYREKNKELIAARRRNNKERIAARRKELRAARLDEVRRIAKESASRAYAEDKPRILSNGLRWREKNREAYNLYCKRWREKNYERWKIIEKKSEAKRRNNNGGCSRDSQVHE